MSKIVEGMIVWHEQLGAGKVLNSTDDGSMSSSQITVAFFKYAQWANVWTDSVKVCNMTGKWSEIEDFFKSAAEV